MLIYLSPNGIFAFNKNVHTISDVDYYYERWYIFEKYVINYNNIEIEHHTLSMKLINKQIYRNCCKQYMNNTTHKLYQ